MKKQQRRLDTERRLVEAVDTLLRTEGPASLSLKRITALARADKVQVYRYFGDLDGLLTAYAEGADLWPSVDEILGPDRRLLDEPDPSRRIAATLGSYAGALRRRPHTLALLAQECSERTPLTIALEAVRERRAGDLARAVAAGGPPEPLVGLAVALFAAAINYLAVRGRDIDVFSGVPIATDQDWQRMEGGIARIVAALLSPSE